MDKPLWMWVSFLGLVLFLLVLDLGFFNRKDHKIGVKESLRMSAGYFSLGILFGFWVWKSIDLESAQLYWTGFLIEQSLSLDNIFVISLILTYFKIPKEYQHRVLFWGILGVIVMRGLMIGLGAAVVSQFNWVLYFFAAFLMFTGVKMLFIKDHDEHDMAKNPVIGFFRKHLRVTDELHGHKFFVRKPHPRTGRTALFLTPLMLALLVVETADLVFAVDSIPAILSITTDTYIVYTSNIFAVLGLRALYFTLSVMLDRFRYLKYALALVLVFIGAKVFLTDFVLDKAKFPPMISLGVTVGLLASGVAYSLYKTRKEAKSVNT